MDRFKDDSVSKVWFPILGIIVVSGIRLYQVVYRKRRMTDMVNFHTRDLCLIPVRNEECLT